MEDSLMRLFRELEERLLSPEIRASPEALAQLLADEFMEIGSSGTVYNKQQVIEALQHEPAEGSSTARTADDLAVRPIAADIVLVTYRTVRPAAKTAPAFHALRSSIWKRIDGRWQMVFHQGTPTRRP
jgi:hypothetical protein